MMILSFGMQISVKKAIVAMLKEFNGKQPYVGNVYIIMRALHYHVAAWRNALFNMPPSRGSIKKKEALVCNDLHYVDVLFNLHLIHDMELRDEQHAIVGLMKVFHKFSDTNKGFQAVKGALKVI